MTESEWLSAREPDDLLEFLRTRGSDRQFRLFICACCRRFVPLMPKEQKSDADRCLSCIEHGEKFADGAISNERLAAIWRKTSLPQDAGCEDADILEHGRKSGPHVRGCWVVDRILAME